MSTPDPLRAAIERAVGAQYEIVRLLGRGGMGVVYLARERALERSVAIKVLPPEISVNAEAQERFRREARTAAKLTHPNIVPLHTFGEVEGMMYFVMGYVEGESLADRLRRGERIPVNDTRRIIGDMADALDYAHRQGVIHRDIKPDNILVDHASGRPMLTDFGIAKAAASGETLTQMGTAIGTPAYMSPEQASGGGDLDGRSDLYSLGVVGYAMVAGRAPFEGTNAQEVLVQHVTKEPPPLERVASGVPGDLAKAITRCLAKAPESRWPDGASLREAVADTGQADEAVLEKRGWFDGIYFAWVVPACYCFALLMGLLGTLRWEWGTLFIESPAEVGPPYPVAIGLLTLILSILVAVPILVGAYATRLSARKGRMPAVHRMVLRQPSWWRGWYSAPLRHPAMAARWVRLPLGIRTLQSLYDVSMLVLLLAYVPVTLALLGESFEPGDDIVLQWPYLGSFDVRLFYGPLETTVVMLCLAGYAAGVFWAMRRGLTYRESHRLISGRALAPTYEAAVFWKKPHIARLLRSDSVSKTTTPEPATATDYLSQIENAGRELSGPSRELGTDATSAARQLVGDLQALDVEIEKLSRDVDTSEIPRLEEKIAALGDPETESTAGRQMRELLTNQLQLMQQLADGLEHATARRTRLMEMLNTLWLQMGNLRAEAARESLESEEVTGKIRAICEEIERHAEATAEVDQLTSSSETE